MIQITITIITIILVARFILKGYKAEPVLFLAGLILMFCTLIGGYGPILTKGAVNTGIEWLNPFEVIKNLFSSRVANLGLMIMALMGFAKYMDYIGANEATVRVVTGPLRKLKSPYILLFFSYLLASLLQLAIPSATGLAVLLMGTMYPIMVGLGISRASAAGVIATSLGIAYTPTAIDAIRGAEAVNIDVVKYVVSFQGLPAIITVLAVGITHIIWQKYCDNKEKLVPQETDIKEQKGANAPAFYAILPLLPILIAVGSSEMFVTGIKLNIITIVIVSITIAMSIEFLRSFDFKKVCDGFGHFLKGMGEAFTHVVALLVAAGIFAHGIKTIGAIEILINFSQHVGLPAFAMAIVFALITLAAAIIMGSGNAPFLAFVELIPQIASSMGANAIAMILPMQQASHMGRSLSPVSGVIIAVSSGAKLSPFAVVKRTSVPMIAGFIIHTSIIGIFY